MITEKQLHKVAEEFNEVMGLDPSIDISLPVERVTRLVKAAMRYVDPEDEFSEDTLMIIKEFEEKGDLKVQVEKTKPEKPKTKTEVAEEIHKRNIADRPIKVVADDEKKEVKIPKTSPKSESGGKVNKVIFFTPYIEAGKYTQKELIQIGCDNLPGLSRSTFQTFLTDSKNPKYNKFPKLVVQDLKGILSFKED